MGGSAGHVTDDSAALANRLSGRSDETSAKCVATALAAAASIKVPSSASASPSTNPKGKDRREELRVERLMGRAATGGTALRMELERRSPSIHG